MARCYVNIGDSVIFEGDDCIVIDIRPKTADSRNILVRDSYGSEFLVSKNEIWG
jgi:hypothetical protein